MVATASPPVASTLPSTPGERALIERAIAAIGPHDPDKDHGLDVDAHARDTTGRADADGLRAILAHDPFTRETCRAYQEFDQQARTARRRFEWALSTVTLVTLGAILLALFTVAVPQESTRWTRAGYALTLGVITDAVLSFFPWLYDRLRKRIGGWKSHLLRGAGVLLLAVVLFRYLPQPFNPLAGFPAAALTLIALLCAGAADFIGGGMTARVLGRRSMHSRWYEARGKAEAHRRQLFLAVASAGTSGASAGEVPLLSQKLEYFRRYQIEVQQSYYQLQSQNNLYGARKAEIARIIAFLAASVLLVFAALGFAAVNTEQGSWWSAYLPEKFAGWLVELSHKGVDDFILMVAMLALGAYAYLQLRSTLLREKTNHRRFSTALGQLRQASSASPGELDHAIATPLRDARLAAVRGDHAAVEAFVRNVNRLLATEVGDWNTMTSFTIVEVNGKPRLFSAEKLSAKEDFEKVVESLRDHKCASFKARKISYVAARQATGIEKVETRYDGKETEDTAKPGDWIVTNMDIERRIMRDTQDCVNSYVIRKDTFARLYALDKGEEQPFGAIYKAKGVVDAVEVAGGFDIVAPWGERQQGPGGYILRNGDDVYGIHKDAFDKTYERLK